MHAFSTRLGGVSEPPYASLNLGFGSGDSRARVLRNRGRFSQAVGIDPDDLITLRQVHGNQVSVLTQASDTMLVRGTPGDGLITNRPYLPLAVITADCFPVVLAVPGLPAVGILHAGRKGTAARLVPTAIALLCQAFNVSPAAVYAIIGPGIGGCCYEVDDASAKPFLTQFAADAAVYWPSRRGHMFLDLQQAIMLQLSTAGIPSAQVWSANLCTACHPHWFYSYRREGSRSGRMLNVAMIQPSTAAASRLPPSSCRLKSGLLPESSREGYEPPSIISRHHLRSQGRDVQVRGDRRIIAASQT
jgi:polyphenol oxidase